MNKYSKAALRVRPLTLSEAGQKGTRFDLTPSTLTVTGQTFQFDSVFDADSSQEVLYQYFFKDIKAALKEECNSAIIVAGPLSSGKTFTLFGRDSATISNSTPAGCVQQTFLGAETAFRDEGLVPRLARDLFGLGLVGDIFVSFVEVYNETLVDLTNPRRKGLKIHESPMDGVYVQNLTEYEVRNAQEVLNVLRNGEKQRRVRAMKGSPQSSRSHALFQIIVERIDEVGEERICHRNKVNLVDLASSHKTLRKMEGGEAFFQESVNINRGLNALSRVIESIAEKKVPVYRDSLLTSLLKDSFGVGTYCSVMVCLSHVVADLKQLILMLRTFSKVHALKCEPKTVSVKLPAISPGASDDLESKRAMLSCHSKADRSFVKEEGRQRSSNEKGILKRLQQLEQMKQKFHRELLMELRYIREDSKAQSSPAKESGKKFKHKF